MTLSVTVEGDGTLSLRTGLGGHDVVRLAEVGLEVRSGSPLSGPYEALVELQRSQRSDSFELPSGKSRCSTLEASYARFAIQHRQPEHCLGRQLQIEVVVAETGTAYRLILAAASSHLTDSATIDDEILNETTSIACPSDTEVWMQDHDRVGKVSPAYEGWYSNGASFGELVPTDAGWTLPALFENDGQWWLLAESGPDGNTGASHLNLEVDNGSRHLKFNRPHADEGDPDHGVTASGYLPLITPWRVMVIGSLGDVVSSDLVRHLNLPAEGSADYSWVRSGRVAWSWWSDHDSPKNAEALRASIDAASTLGWEYALIDANWNQLPGGAIEELVAHGKARNVDLMLWYNSGGPNNTMTEEPRDLMTDSGTRIAEFKRIAELGIVGVKVDFFHSDKPLGIAQFLDILADAAEARLMVNFHGCTTPKGWSRTYPNLMTTEGVRGAEWYRLSDDYGANAPIHNTILAFTRNVVGSMDYTPVALSDLAQNRRTSNGHELALAVVFESGLLHFCDAPEFYVGQPDHVRRFLSEVPAAWDESRLLEGRPGSHVVMARRSGTAWYIGAINGRDEPVSVNVDVSQLDPSLDPATRFEFLSCPPDAPRSVTGVSMAVADLATTSFDLPPSGGWVLRIEG